MTKFISTLSAAIAISLLSNFAAFAQVTDTWNGTGADWNTTGDWNSAVPTSADTAVFDSTGSATPDVTLSASGTAKNIQFNSNSTEYVIGTTTGPAITLTAGGTTGITFGNNPTTIETINAPLILGDTGANETYTFHNSVVQGDVLNFNGSISGAAGAGDTTTLDISGIVSTYNGVISDGTNGGQLAITFGTGTNNETFTAAETYTGNTTLNNNSTITLTGAGAFGNTFISVNTQGTLNLDTAGAVSQNILQVTGGTLTEDVANAITGTASLIVQGGGGLATITDAQNYTGATIISDGNNGGTLTISGSGALTATPSITVGTGGTLNLNTANAIFVTPTVNGGTMNVNAANAITGSIGINVSGNGTVNITAPQDYTGTTYIGGGTYYNDGTNNPGPVGSPNPIVARTPNFIISGAGSLGDTAVTVSDNPGGYPAYLELNAPGAISQNVLTIIGSQVTQGVAGAITGTTTVNINESDTSNYNSIGTAYFGDGNTYTGTTTLDGSNSHISLNVTQLANGGSASSIGSSSSAASNLLFGGGTLQASNLTSAQSTDRLFTIGDAFSNAQGVYGSGYSATIDSSSIDPNDTISFTNTGAIASGMSDITVYSSISLTLTGSNTGANTFAPLITNLTTANSALTNLTKSGAGNWILTNANTFSGSTTISGGTLQLGNFNALQDSSVVLNSANGLTFGSNGTYNIPSLSGSVDESLASGITLGFGLQVGIRNQVYNSYTFSGVLSGAGGVAQQSAFDNEVFTASNTYAGGTTVNAGTLESTLATDGSPFGTGSLTINGGTLELAPSGSGSAIADTGATDSGANLTYGGGGTLLLNEGSNTSLTFTVGDGTDPALVRSGTGTLIVRTNSADLGSGENLVVAGPAPAMTSGIVSPTIVGYNNSTNLFDFLTYGGSYTGFGVANSTNDSAYYIDHSTDFTTTAGEIANITANVTVTDSGGNPYAIRTASGGVYLTIANGTTLTVGDGVNPAGLIFNGNGYYGPSGGIADGGNSVLNFGASQAVIFSNNWSEIQSQITGSGGMVISGAGSTYLGSGGVFSLDSNSNSFTGGITVNSGAILSYTGSFNGNIFENGTLGDPNNVITLNGGSINLSGSIFGIGRDIILTSAGGNFLGQEGAYAADISGSGSLSIGSYQPGGTDGYDYPSSGFTSLSGNNTFTGGLILNNAYVAVSSNASLGASTSPIIFQGGFVDVMGDSMHDFGSHPLTFVQGDSVAIDIADANNTFTLSQGLDQGSGGFYKTGSGTLVLTGANTYTGQTGLLGGTLEVQEAGGGLSSASELYFAGGTLDIVGNSTGTTVQNFNGVLMGINANVSDATSGGGSLIVDSNGGGGTTVNLGSLPEGISLNPGTSNTGSTLDIAVVGNSTVTTTTAPDGTSGSGGSGIYGGRVVYTDASGNTNWATSGSSGPIYTLTGYNNYSNFGLERGDGSDSFDNDIQNGSTSLLVAGGTPTIINSLKITGAGTLDLAGNNLTLVSGGLLFAGTGAYTISDSVGGGSLMSGLIGTGQANKQSGDDLIIQDYGTGTLTISAVIANGPDGTASTLTKAGPGTLILSGANTYTGQTFVNGGLLSVGNPDSISNSSRLNLNGGGFEATGNITIPNLYLGSSGGTLDASAGNVLTITQINGFISGHPEPAGLTINSNGDTGVVFLDDMGNSGGNNFYGDVEIDGGTLRINNYGGANNFTALGLIPATNYVSWGAGSSGDLQLDGSMLLVAGLESTSTTAIVENGNGSNTNVILGVSNGDDETYAGILEDTSTTGTGQLSFLKAGSGSLSFTNADSSYTGTTELDGGILNVASLADGGADSSIGASTNAASNLIFGGGTLQYTGSTDQSTDRLFTLGDTGVGGNDGTIDSSGTGAVTFSNTGAIAIANTGVHNLTLTGTNTGANTFAPSIGDGTYNSQVFATSLSKTGTGSWAVTNANTYSGGTSVSGGTLYVNNTTGSGTGTGTVAVASGGTLAGTGIIAAASSSSTFNGITVASGGNLAPGGVQPAVGASAAPNGSLTLTPDGVTGGGTVLSASPNAQLTFAIGAGPANASTTVSQLLVSGSAANIMNFNVGGTAGPGGTSTMVAINDLTGGGLPETVDTSTEYILIAGNNNTVYEDNGQTLLAAGDLGAYNSDLNGNEILGGLSLILPTGSNYFSEVDSGAELYLVGNDIVLAVPEPSTWALMLGSLGLLAFYQRRGSKRKMA